MDKQGLKFIKEEWEVGTKKIQNGKVGNNLSIFLHIPFILLRRFVRTVQLMSSVSMSGMPKRPPMGFPNMPGNQNFVQGQVTTSAPGTPGGGANQQLQSSQAMTHTGRQTGF